MIQERRKETKRRQAAGIAKMGLLAACVAAAILIQACGSSSGQSGQKSEAPSGGQGTGAVNQRDIPAVLNYGYIGSNKFNLPRDAEGWGLYKGIIQEELKKYGITEVKTTGFPNGPDLTESLVSGRLDFGSYGDTPSIIAYASGVKTRLISQNRTRLVAYLVGKKDGPKSIQDLKGKTIAVQKGSYLHRYVVGLLQQEGVTDYKIVHMLSPDAVAALARGDIDAATNSGVAALKQLDEGFPLLDISSDHPDLFGSSLTTVSDDYLKKFPDFPKVWDEARAKALEDVKRHPDEYYEFLAEVYSTTPELAKQLYAIEDINEAPFTDEGLKLLEGTKNFLIDEGLARKDFNIGDWVLRTE